MSLFRISGLPSAEFDQVFGLDDPALAALGVRRYRLDANPGIPTESACAISKLARPLVNYTHRPAMTPYRASHAIYVFEGHAETFARVDVVPEVLRCAC